MSLVLVGGFALNFYESMVASLNHRCLIIDDEESLQDKRNKEPSLYDRDDLLFVPIEALDSMPISLSGVDIIAGIGGRRTRFVLEKLFISGKDEISNCSMIVVLPFKFEHEHYQPLLKRLQSIYPCAIIDNEAISESAKGGRLGAFQRCVFSEVASHIRKVSFG